MSQMPKRAVVLVSGGLDSATVLAIAQSQSYECYALSVDYGQRQQAELECAKSVAQSAKLHKIVHMGIGDFGGSALTDETIDVPTCETEDIPVTYVPARNTVFLSVALAWAEVLEAQAIFIGANAVDYSGYPDCRPEYLDAFQTMANLATKAGVEAANEQPGGVAIRIEAPLLDLSKAQIIQTGIELGVDYSQTLSCYAPDDQGNSCGQCDSCRIRIAGFSAAGLSDPAN